MYQVIARTWRPQRFSEVIGQKHITETLQNAIRRSRIGHGYVFSGQRGTGKTSVARLFAKALNCHSGPSPEPCGECDSCLEITAGRAVDVIEIDAASNRGIDAVRELRETARYAPARDRFKVFIIDEAHQITPEGFNALLKTLEEPPSHVVFLLATTEVHQFPETILSRCQHFAFRAIGFSEVLDHLQRICSAEKVEASPEALAALAASGEGSIRDSLSRLEQAIAAFGNQLEGESVRRLLGAATTQLVEAVFSAVHTHDRQAILEVVEQLVKDGCQLNHFCSQLIRSVRNLLVVRVAGPLPHLLESSPQEIERLTKTAQLFSEENLLRFLDILLHLYQDLRHSMEPRFQLELGLLKLVDAERLTSIESLLARLETGVSLPSLKTTTSGAETKNGSSTTLPAAGMSNESKAGKVSYPTSSVSPFERDLQRKKELNSSVATISDGQIEPVSQHTSSSATGDKKPASSSQDIHSHQPSREEVWVHEVLHALKERSKPLLASFIEDVQQWEFGEREVVIRLASGMTPMLEADRPLLSQIVSQIAGRPIQVTFGEEWKQANTNSKKSTRGEKASQSGTGPGNTVIQDAEVQEFEKLFGKPVTSIRLGKGK
ncbi:MAG: DNA polymerase III, subunit gamma and tau [Acidobacteria bacterium RIFCSPLOWO2_12_FULL_54_10]|nr:MAG: DNA polymerase III, subunit gamma and tau [Acidobacteria bacterium RIFCSPLOWO2_12_FULL_54_10]